MYLVEIPDYITKTYLYGDSDFYVDVTIMNNTSDPLYEVYLGHKLYAVKDLMFGIHQKDIAYDDLLDMIIINIDQYIKSFIDDHFE